MGSFRGFKKLLWALAHLWDAVVQDGLRKHWEGARHRAALLQLFRVIKQAAVSGGFRTHWHLLPYS